MRTINFEELNVAYLSEIRQRSTTKWHFEIWLNITLEKNTIICKKLAVIVLDRKNVTRLFVRRKQVSTSAEISQQRTKKSKFFVRCCYTSALVLNLFSPDERSCWAFSTWNYRCEFLASYRNIFQSVIQSIISIEKLTSWIPLIFMDFF